MFYYTRAEQWSGPRGHIAMWGGWPAIPKREGLGKYPQRNVTDARASWQWHLRGEQVYFRCSLWKQCRNGEHKRKAFSERLQVTRGVVGTEDPSH